MRISRRYATKCVEVPRLRDKVALSALFQELRGFLCLIVRVTKDFKRYSESYEGFSKSLVSSRVVTQGGAEAALNLGQNAHAC